VLKICEEAAIVDQFWKVGSWIMGYGVKVIEKEIGVFCDEFGFFVELKYYHTSSLTGRVVTKR